MRECAEFAPVFKRFSAEGALVGQMLTAYGEIEYELFSILCLISDEAPHHLKTVFRLRRRRERLDVIDSLIRPHFSKLGLAAKYAQAMDAVDCCRMLFNQYDSCHWYARDGELLFVDLDDLGEQGSDSAGLRALSTDADLLSLQMAYFDYARLCLVHLRQELGKEGEPDPKARPMPPKRIRPNMFIRECEADLGSKNPPKASGAN